MPEIRTPSARRYADERPPPDAQASAAHSVTTPESLYILLTAEKSRAILRDVETVIVDEIHAVADDKRGVHLSLSLERSKPSPTAARPHRPIATQKPIEEVAHFLAGTPIQKSAPQSRNRQRRHKRKLDLGVEVPSSELGPSPPTKCGRNLRAHRSTRQRHRSTLVFVNTRRLAERISINSESA